jgi:ferredoxin-type protein NapG
MLDRKDFFKKGFVNLFKKVKETQDMVAEVPFLIKESLTEKVTPEEESSALRTVPEFSKPKKIKKNIKYPPGAITPKEKFESKCNSCGDCITSCPYGTIFPVFDSTLNRNFPFIDPNLIACQLCKDTPCITSCKTGALKPLKKKESISLGRAKIIFTNCINHSSEEANCNSCANSCPVNGTINLKKGKPIVGKSCTGCGICAQACPTFPKSIIIK